MTLRENSRGIHVFGASGSGATTLGRLVAERTGALHLDADAYYWIDTDPPFTTKRAPGERVAMMRRDMVDASAWVLSGSICSWGDDLIDRFDLAVFLELDRQTRLWRLRERERRRFGDRIAPGGDMHAQHVEFMDWAAGYDDGRAPQRSRHLHETWLKGLACPVLRLNARTAPERLVEEVLAQWSG